MVLSQTEESGKSSHVTVKSENASENSSNFDKYFRRVLSFFFIIIIFFNFILFLKFT